MDSNYNYVNVIERFSFSSTGNAVDWADLTIANHYRSAGISQTDYGYCAGGSSPNTDTIDKYPFASQTNATDVGNLTAAKFQGAGTQY